MQDFEIFEKLCFDGNLLEAQRMHTSGFNIKKYMILGAVRGGNISLVKWLYSLGLFDIMTEAMFIEACKIGHLHIVEWLHSSIGVDIHVPDYCFQMKNYAFFVTTLYHKLNVAKYLHSLDSTVYQNHKKLLNDYTIFDLESGENTKSYNKYSVNCS